MIVIALVLTLGPFLARRTGLIAETVTVASSGAAFGGAEGEGPMEREFKIITLLPKDGIPAIFNPKFVTAEFAERQFRTGDQVIGVSINGEHRAYGTAFLSSHEVVNDTVGGRPIAVTW
jgi:hypothetical protein